MTTALFATIGVLVIGIGTLIWLWGRARKALGLAEQRIYTLEKNLETARDQLKIAQNARPGDGVRAAEFGGF